MAQVGSGKVGTPDNSYIVQQSGDTVEKKIGFAKVGAGYVGGNISLYKVFCRTRCTRYSIFKVVSYLRIGLIYAYLVSGAYFDYALHFIYALKGNPRSFFYRSFSILAYVSKPLVARIMIKGIACFFPTFRLKVAGYLKANYAKIFKISSSVKRSIFSSYKIIGTAKAFFYKNIPIMGRSKANFVTAFTAFGHLSGLASKIYTIHSSLKANVSAIFKVKGKATTYYAFKSLKVTGRVLVLMLISTLSKRTNKPSSEGLTLFNDAENDGERRVRK